MARIGGLLDRLRFRLRLLVAALTLPPVRGGSPDGDDGDDGDQGDDAGDKGDAGDAGEPADKGGDDDAQGQADAGTAGDAADAGGDDVRGSRKDVDWVASSRKHERNFKRARTALSRVVAGDSIADAAKAAGIPEERLNEWLPDDVKQKVKDREDAAKSEHQKAIDDATAKARTEVEERYETSRRQDRLEVAVTRVAAKGLKIGKGKDEKTVRFADPEDALVHLERALSRDELDNDELFDENGRVKADVLQSSLVELLERKPHLAEREGNGSTPPPGPGDSDAGKGSGAGAGVEDMTPEDHYQAIRKAK